jgi:hypothetical protein
MTAKQKFWAIIVGVLTSATIVGLCLTMVITKGVKDGIQHVMAAESFPYNPPQEVLTGQHLVEGRIEGIHFYTHSQAEMEGEAQFMSNIHKRPDYTRVNFFGSDQNLNLCGDQRDKLDLRLGRSYAFIIQDSNKAEYDSCFSAFAFGDDAMKISLRVNQ